MSAAVPWVVLVGWRPASARALVRLGCRVTCLVAPSAAERARREPGVDVVVVGRPDSVEECLAALARHGVTLAEVDRVCSGSELTLTTAAVLEELRPGGRSGAVTAVGLRDKAVQKSLAAAAGVPVAQVRVVDDLEESGAWLELVDRTPGGAVVKPLAGAGASDTFRVRTRADAPAVLARTGAGRGPWLVESFVDGCEHQVDGVVRAGEVRTLVVSRYLRNLIDVHEGAVVGAVALDAVRYADLYDRARLLTDATLAALGHTDGVFHLEAFDTADGLVLGECAGRVSGGMLDRAVAHLRGVDVHEQWALALLDLPATDVCDTERPAGAVCGDVYLGAPPGRVVRVPSAQEVRDRPGVIDVRLDVTAGAQMPDMTVATDVRAATALVVGDDEETVERRLLDLAEWFREACTVVADDALVAVQDVEPAVLAGVEHVLVGYSSTVLRVLDRHVAPGSVLVLEEPDVAAARGVVRACAARPCVAVVAAAPVHDESPDAPIDLVPRPPRVRSVLAAVDYGVVWAARLADAWAVRGAGSTAAAAFRDKATLRAVADAGGIPQPRWSAAVTFDDVRSAAATWGDVVVKPSNLQGSVGVRLVDADAGPEALRSAWDDATGAGEPRYRSSRATPPRFLVEERVRGREVSVETFVLEGRSGFRNVTGKRVLDGPCPVEIGHVVPADDLPAAVESALHEAVDALVRATGLRTAVLHSEWIVDAHGTPHLVECAARLPGDGIHDLIDRAYGTDVVATWLGLMADDDLPVPASARQAAAIGFVGVHVDEATAASVLSTVRSCEGVREAELSPSAGSTGPVRDSSGRTGSVVVEARTPAQAARLMEAAVRVAEEAAR